MTETQNRIRVVLCDDHPIVLDGLRGIIVTQPDLELVGEADDGIGAIKLAEQLIPHVVVMDMSMPRLNGVDATKRIKAALPDIRVLALTVHDDRSYLRQFIEAGVSGYVLKRAAAAELVHAIRTIVSGGLYIDPMLGGDIVSALYRPQPTVQQFPASILSDREQSVLRRIALGLTNKEIAANLDVSVKSVETYK